MCVCVLRRHRKPHFDRRRSWSFATGPEGATPGSTPAVLRLIWAFPSAPVPRMRVMEARRNIALLEVLLFWPEIRPFLGLPIAYILVVVFRNLLRIVRPGQAPTSTTPGETRQGGVKRTGTEAPRSHQLPLNGNLRTEEREKPTHLKEKPNKKLPGLHNTTERWPISRRALSRDRLIAEQPFYSYC